MATRLPPWFLICWPIMLICFETSSVTMLEQCYERWFWDAVGRTKIMVNSLLRAMDCNKAPLLIRRVTLSIETPSNNPLPNVSEVSIAASRPLALARILCIQSAIQAHAMRSAVRSIDWRFPRIPDGRRLSLARQQERVSIGLCPAESQVAKVCNEEARYNRRIDVPVAQEPGTILVDNDKIVFENPHLAQGVLGISEFCCSGVEDETSKGLRR